MTLCGVAGRWAWAVCPCSWPTLLLLLCGLYAPASCVSFWPSDRTARILVLALGRGGCTNGGGQGGSLAVLHSVARYAWGRCMFFGGNAGRWMLQLQGRGCVLWALLTQPPARAPTSACPVWGFGSSLPPTLHVWGDKQLSWCCDTPASTCRTV